MALPTLLVALGVLGCLLVVAIEGRSEWRQRAAEDARRDADRRARERGRL